MIIAVSTYGKDLNSQLDPRFGRCSYFLVVNPDDMSFEVFKNESAVLGGGAGIQSAQLLASKGVDTVITGNCGPNAVQTLSRLNRICPPYKEETMVLDFVNEAEHIQKAFEPFYEATLLSEETDPNVLYQLQDELDEFHFYSDEEIDEFVEVYFKGDRQDLSTLYALLTPVAT